VSPAHEAATADLRDAVLTTRPSDDWWSEDQAAFDLVQYSIARWVDDLGLGSGRFEAGDDLGWVVSSADDALGLLADATATLAKLGRKVAVIPPPLYVWPEGEDSVRATEKTCLEGGFTPPSS
jgi:hypothetical protein